MTENGGQRRVPTLGSVQRLDIVVRPTGRDPNKPRILNLPFDQLQGQLDDERFLGAPCSAVIVHTHL